MDAPVYLGGGFVKIARTLATLVICTLVAPAGSLAQPVPGATPGSAGPPIPSGSTIFQPPPVIRMPGPIGTSPIPAQTSPPRTGIGVVTMFTVPTLDQWRARARANGIDVNAPNLEDRLRVFAANRRTNQRQAQTLETRLASPKPTANPIFHAISRASLQASGFDPNRALSLGTNAPASPISDPSNPTIVSISTLSAIDTSQNQSVSPVVITGLGFVPADTVWIYTPSCGGIFGTPLVRSKTSSGYDSLTFDRSPLSAMPNEQATISVRDGNHVTPAVNVPIAQDAVGYFDFAVNVRDDNTIYCLRGCGKNSLDTPSRSSTNPRDAPVEGDDILMYDVHSVNDFTPTASIAYVQSFNDPPGPIDSNNQFRSAVITSQPSNGRMITKIHWRHAGGESVNYGVSFTFSQPSTHGGRGIFRRYDAEPKYSACPNES